MEYRSQLILSYVLRGLLAGWLAVTLTNGSQQISEGKMIFIFEKIPPVSLQRNSPSSLQNITGATRSAECQSLPPYGGWPGQKRGWTASAPSRCSSGELGPRTSSGCHVGFQKYPIAKALGIITPLCEDSDHPSSRGLDKDSPKTPIPSLDFSIAGVLSLPASACPPVTLAVLGSIWSHTCLRVLYTSAHADACFRAWAVIFCYSCFLMKEIRVGEIWARWLWLAGSEGRQGESQAMQPLFFPHLHPISIKPPETWSSSGPEGL